MKASAADAPANPWQRFLRIRREKGLLMRRIVQDTGMSYMNIWGMLNGGMNRYTDTPEKRAALVRALNMGPGDPVTESDIWPDDAGTTGQPEDASDGPAA